MTASLTAEDITHRHILRVAIPIVLSNASVPLLGVVDTFAIGQLGAAQPIGGVAIGAIVLSAIYWVFGFLRMGTTGLVAQAHGAGDTAEVSALLTRALLIAAAGGLFFILLQAPLTELALRLSPASPEVEVLAREYILTRIWGAPAAIGVYALMGWLVAREQSGGVLALQMVMNGLNIILSLWFVLGLEWGVFGVAFATAISEWVGLAIGLFLSRSAFAHPAWRDPRKVFDRARIRQMMAVNTDIMIRSVVLQVCFLAITFQGAALGDVTLAANQILYQFFTISAYALDGFAFASEALVGAAIGARNRTALRRAAVLGSVWGLTVVGLLSLVYWVFGAQLIGLMTTADDVVATALIYLPWCVLAPAIGLPAFMLDGVFIGATRTRDLRNMMILSALIYFACLFPLVAAFGNHGLWGALVVFFIARAVTLGWKYPALERDAEG